MLAGIARGNLLRNNRIDLGVADIDPDGSYEGTAALTRSDRNVGGGSPDGGRAGSYEGAFYGPAGVGLETAGTWRLILAEWHPDIDAIIGSFGATCGQGDCAPPATSP